MMSCSQPDINHEIKADNLRVVKATISKLSSTLTHLQRYNFLKLATLCNSTNVAKYFLMMNYEVNFKDRFSYTPLHFASIHGNAEIVSMLLNRNAFIDIVSLSSGSLTPLFVAMDAGHDNIVEMLLSRTPSYLVSKYLHFAFNCRKPKVETIELILNYGASINAVSSSENFLCFTPLHLAVVLGNINIIKLLASKGAEINAVASKWKIPLYFSPAKDVHVLEDCTPLLIASVIGKTAVIEFLLEHGASIDFCDKNGNTALYLAVERGYFSVVKLIVSHQPDINNDGNRKAAVCAIVSSTNNLNVIQCLLDYGISIGSENVSNKNLLHAAVRKGLLKIVTSLIENGADVNAVYECDKYDETLSGFSLLHNAVYFKNEEISKFLLCHGADVNFKDSANKCPIFYAIKNGDFNVSKLLLHNGAQLNNDDIEAFNEAVFQECLDIVELILQHDQNFCINGTDALGRTPLLCTALIKNDVLYLKKNEMSRIYFVGCQYKKVYSNDSIKGAIAKLLLVRGAEVNKLTECGITPLMAAARNGFKKVVEALIEFNVDVNALDDYGRSALHFAVLEEQEEFIEILLKSGCRADTKDIDGKTPLHVAAKKGFLNNVKILLSSGVDFELKDESDETALHYACHVGDEEVVKCLAEFCHSFYNENHNTERTSSDFIDGRNKDQLTPLMIACKGSNKNIINVLLKFGANINCADFLGRTALRIAVEIGSLNNVKLLLKNGADYKLKDKIGRTVLHVACEKQSKNIVECLLQFDRTLNENRTTQNSFNDFINGEDNAEFEFIPLLISIQSKNEKICKMLLDFGAETNLIDIKGRTVLHFAVKCDSLDIVKIFLKYGFEYTLKDDKGQTALHLACKYRNEEIVKCLLEFDNAAGNEYVKFNDGFLEFINLKNENHLTSLMVATTYNFDNIIRILLNFGADTEAADINGCTALHIAAEQRRINSFKTLLKFGSDINAITNDGVTPLCCLSLDSLFPDDCEEVINILKEHFLKFKAAELYLHDKNLQFFHDNQIVFYYSGQTGNENSSFFNDCVVEVNELKNCFIYGISFYDVIAKSQNKLARWASNKKMFKSMNLYNYEEEFPIYAYIINNRFKMAVKRNFLIKECILHLNSVVSSEFLKLPNTHIDNILAFLNNADLERLIAACKPPSEIL